MKSSKEYARRQLKTGTLAVHVLHDIATKMDPINICGDLEAGNETASAESAGPEKADIETNDFNENTSEVELFDAIDEATATHYTLTSMGNPYKTFYGRLQPNSSVGQADIKS